MKPRRFLEHGLLASGAALSAYACFALLPRGPGLLGGLLAIALALALSARLGKGKSAPDGVSRPTGSIDNEFVGRVSHELRTPLNGILGLTQILIDRRPGGEERELLEMIRTSGDTVLRIINDLLDYSRIQAGKIRLETEEFRLHRLVRQSVRTFAPQAHQKGLELAFWVAPEVPDVVFGNPQRLRQVLANLIVNAIKFTEQGEILVEVTRDASKGAREGEARVTFEVTDTGVGISPASLPRIFGAFVQGDNDRAEHAGLGLGLTISAELVERMGGTLSARSEEGRGSRFRFDVLFEKAVFEDRPELSSSARGTRALVVDDSAMQRHVMAKQLALLGVEVELADGAESALLALERSRQSETPFSVLFLDSRIPGVDTSALARELQKRSKMPAVLMALASDRVNPESLRKLGILGHLTKPIAPAHLQRAIAILLRGSAVEKPEDVQTQGMDRPFLVGLKVLLADDHPVNRTVVARTLEAGGSAVTAVADGKEALDRWSKERFDLLVLDVEMPEIDGLTVARRIRGLERTRGGTHLPIVALTAHAREEDRERCFEAGMDAFATKPIEEVGLTLAIETALRSARRARSEGAGATVFDRDKALARANGDSALLAELVDLFLEETPGTLRTISEALAREDHGVVERLSHRLKGALLTLSANRAASAASNVELAARRSEGSACKAALGELEIELGRLEEELKASEVGI